MKTAADVGVRTLPWVEPPPQSERQFYSAPSDLFNRGWSDRVPAVPLPGELDLLPERSLTGAAAQVCRPRLSTAPEDRSAHRASPRKRRPAGADGGQVIRPGWLDGGKHIIRNQLQNFFRVGPSGACPSREEWVL